MKAYISVSLSNRESVNDAITTIVETLFTFKITPLVFVDSYKFDSSQERQMMYQAMSEIDNCNLLIAETSEKGIGLGVEVGYAKAKGKTVIYVRNKKAEHSTTVSGISDFHIIYSDAKDLHKQLFDTLNDIVTFSN